MQFNKTVLVVDDDADIRMGARTRLELAGYGTLMAIDGVDGVDQATRSHPDAVLLDVRMPRMDGLTALAELRSRSDTRHIPVVMISASLSDEKAALQGGASYFVRKPYLGRSLLAAVGAAVAQG
jgi:CheY-like chemotaxis protein